MPSFHHSIMPDAKWSQVSMQQALNYWLKLNNTFSKIQFQ